MDSRNNPKLYEAVAVGTWGQQMSGLPEQTDMHFDGETYDPSKDKIRLGSQAYKVFEVMRDGEWRTLQDIAHATQMPEASISARLRDFRKERFGEHEVQRQRCPDTDAQWEYRLVVNERKSVEAK